MISFLFLFSEFMFFGRFFALAIAAVHHFEHDFFEYKESFGDEEGVALFGVVDEGVDKFFDGHLLEIGKIEFPYARLEGDAMGGFEATEGGFEVEAVEFIADEFFDGGIGVADEEVVADASGNFNEGCYKVIHFIHLTNICPLFSCQIVGHAKF